MKSAILSFLALITISISFAQNSTPTKPDTSFKAGGQIWANAFGDYYYKSHTDALNRGGANQYTNIEKGRNAFQFRRIYLGYNYNITSKFSAELLLSSEDNIVTASGTTSGDLLSDNKLAFYIKLMNVRWKNIWKGTDLLVGQCSTPAFPLLTEQIWGYRSIERTVSDIRRTPSFDLGASLQGRLDPGTDNYGYNLMVGNGSTARPENDKFKWFYGDVWAKFLNKKLIFDLYADYERLNWTTTLHHSRSMVKGFVAYTTPKITVGVEAFINHGKQDVVGITNAHADTIDANAQALSAYVRGTILKDKLAFFARVDKYDPNVNYLQSYNSYKGLTSTYEPNNKETFITAGLDFTPIKNVHFMPNIWYDQYRSKQASANPLTSEDHDLVYRVTFYYSFGR